MIASQKAFSRKTMIYIILTVLLSFSLPLASQGVYKTIGDSLYNVGNVTEAISYFRQQSPDSNAKYSYKLLAQLYALENNADSSLQYIQKVTNIDSNFLWLLSGDFYNLKENSHWQSILHNQLQKNAKKNNLSNPERMFQLSLFRLEDQAYYYPILYKNRTNTDSITYYFKLKGEINKVLRLQAKEYLALYGCPKYSQVGNLTSAIFLIVQHSNDLNFMKDYLRCIQKTAEENETPKDEIALLSDRILLLENKKQLYGTQLLQDKITGKCYLKKSSVRNFKKIHYRRKKLGIETLDEYLKLMYAEIRE